MSLCVHCFLSALAVTVRSLFVTVVGRQKGQVATNAVEMRLSQGECEICGVSTLFSSDLASSRIIRQTAATERNLHELRKYPVTPTLYRNTST